MPGPVKALQKPQQQNQPMPPPKPSGAKLRKALHFGSSQAVQQGSAPLPLGVPASQMSALGVELDQEAHAIPPPPDEKPPLSDIEVLALVTRFDLLLRSSRGGSIEEALTLAASPDFRAGATRAVRVCEAALGNSTWSAHEHADGILAVISSVALADEATRIADELVSKYPKDHRFKQELEWLQSGKFGFQTMARATLAWDGCMDSQALKRELDACRESGGPGGFHWTPYVERMRNALLLLQSGILGVDDAALKAFLGECERGADMLKQFISLTRGAFDLSDTAFKNVLRTHGVGEALLAVDFPRVSEMLQLSAAKAGN